MNPPKTEYRRAVRRGPGAAGVREPAQVRATWTSGVAMQRMATARWRRRLSGKV
tara:strand:- start:32 stop:193 length:162 start_codon:yes stop_codon:yes gene_type:complete